MKRPKDNIFRLIHAMSPAEKRYFKRHYASDQNMMTDLFDYINNLKSYDEDLVKQHFSDTKVAQNLKVYKVQLFDLILKSLTSYHNKKSVLARIRLGLEEVDILLNKQLNELALDRLDRIKQLCIKYEKFTYLIEIAHKEFRLRYIKNDRVGISKMSIFEDLENYLKHLDAHTNLFKQGNQLLDRSKATSSKEVSSEEAQQLKELLQTDILVEEPQGLSFRTKLSRNMILTTIHSRLKNEELEGHYRLANIQLFESYPQFQEELVWDYVGVLRNYMNFCLRQRQYDVLPGIVTKAQKLGKTNQMVAEQYIYFLYGNIEAYYRQGKFEAIETELDPQVNKQIKQFHLEQDRIVMMIHIFLAQNQLILGNQEKAQKYIRKLQASAAANGRFFVEVTDTLELISHFESNDDFLVGNRLQSLNRKTRDKVDVSPFFLELLSLFKNLLRRPHQKVSLVKETIEKMEESPEEELVYIIRHFQLDNWLFAMESNQAFANYMKKEFPRSKPSAAGNR